MTERQRLFCDNYISDPFRNATKAAIEAGYSEKSARGTASRMLTNANIQAYIFSKEEPLEGKYRGDLEERILSRDQVLAAISCIALDTEKDETRLKALELLGKYYNLFSERKEIDVKQDKSNDLNMSLSERKAYLDELMIIYAEENSFKPVQDK